MSDPQAPSGDETARAQTRSGPLRNCNPRGDLSKAPRCGARTRRGTPCQSPAMPNGRCRMHGGPSTGPRTPEGQERSRKANWKHGRYSRKYLAEEAYYRAWLSYYNTLLKLLREVDELLRIPSAEQNDATRWMVRRLFDALDTLQEPIPPKSLERNAPQG